MSSRRKCAEQPGDQRHPARGPAEGARVKRDGWYSKNALFIELLRDYVKGRITPAAAPLPFDPAKAGRRRAS